MTENVPATQRDDEVKRRELADRLRDEIWAKNTGQAVTPRGFHATRRPLPANAYVRPGLGDLPLSSQLRSALGLISDLLIPLVDGVEAKQPQVLECSVCRRNLGGWPPSILSDHYWQHTWLQRKLAGIGVR